eukprot:8361299-Alexandrium_andersonii.AAC.1
MACGARTPGTFSACAPSRRLGWPSASSACPRSASFWAPTPQPTSPRSGWARSATRHPVFAT